MPPENDAHEIKPGEIPPGPSSTPVEPPVVPAVVPATAVTLTETPSDFEAFKAAQRAGTLPITPAAKTEEKAVVPPVAEAPKPGEEPPVPPVEKPKNKTPAAERIAQLTKKNGETERQAQATAAENAELKARLEALERGEKPAPKSDDEDGEPNPEDPKYKYGEVDAKYIADLASWSTRKTVREERTRDAQSRQEHAAAAEAAEAHEQLADFLEAGTTKHADFAEVVYEGGRNGTYALGPAVWEMIQNSDVGHQVAYHIAKNPAEAAKIHNMGPAAQAREFMKLESRFEAAPTPPPTTKHLPKAEAPPAKHETVRGASGQFTDVPKDFDAFKAKVRAESTRR